MIPFALNSLNGEGNKEISFGVTKEESNKGD